MLSAAHLAGMHADLDGLRVRLDTMVAAAAGPRVVIPAPRTPGESGRESLPAVCDQGEGDQEELAEQGASQARPQPRPGTLEAIARGLELPTLARRRFRADSGCVLADADRKSRAGGLADRHPAAKVLALWGADLADGLAWRQGYEIRAWGYAALRWLLVDPSGAAGAAGRPPEPGADVGPDDVARLRAATGLAAETARRSGAGQARQALVKQLSTDAARLLRGRCGAELNRELLAVTAEATLLAGRLTYACWPSAALAQAYFVQALALAQACGDRQLGAAVLCAMSEQAFFNGHLDEARNLVGTALKGTCGVASPELALHFRLLTARDHMHRDELMPCVRALKDAVTQFDGAGPGDEPGWTRWFTESDPLLFARVLADAYQAAELPGPAREIRLAAQ